MNRIFLLLSLIIFSCGCFAHAPVKKINIQESIPQATGNIIDFARLKAGGKLGILPFKAGPQAEANDTLDHLSALLVKGIQDSLQAGHVPFVITDSESKADFILEGYIEEYFTPGRFSKLILRKKKSRLSTSGEIWSKTNGLKVLTFASTSIIGQNSSVDDTAYHMGQAIGDYIVSQAKE